MLCPASNSDMDNDFDLDITLVKDDLLLCSLTPSSSSSSLYQLHDQSLLYRRTPSFAGTTTTITTTTTTTTTTTIAASAPSSPINQAPAHPESAPCAPMASQLSDDKASSKITDDPHHGLKLSSSSSLPPLVSEGPFLFLFDVPLSLYYPVRALILFILGFAFSLVVDHLQTQHNLIKYPSNMHQLWDTASWLPPTCGMAAVLVGTIYPLGDYLWWGRRANPSSRDWSSVTRCFGGFIGVNYAASRLPPWTSSMQVSCTLALISIGLWFWFDRTFHGFVISLAVASSGTLVAYFLVLNGWYSFTRADFFGVGSWIPCILYSSSVCFGSIGRQLDVVPVAWYDSKAARIHVASD